MRDIWEEKQAKGFINTSPDRFVFKKAEDTMSRNKWLIVAASAIVACFCIICAGALVAFFRPSLLNPLMPVYEYKIVPSAHEGYSLHTLTGAVQPTKVITQNTDFGLTGLTSKLGRRRSAEGFIQFRIRKIM